MADDLLQLLAEGRFQQQLRVLHGEIAVSRILPVIIILLLIVKRIGSIQAVSRGSQSHLGLDVSRHFVIFLMNGKLFFRALCGLEAFHQFL